MAKAPKNSLMEKMMKLSTTGVDQSPLTESVLFNDRELVKLDVPIMNLALGGIDDGGLQAGVFLLAAPSRHFKSVTGLIACRAYMNKYPESVMIFYDNELGANKGYFEAADIDMNRVIHCPFMTLEGLRSDLATKLDGIERGDKVIFFVDSIGNAASAREVNNAIEEKTTADMQRAAVAKSLFRVITPMLNKADVPLVAIMHVYQSMETYSKTIMSGGTGGMLSASDVWFIGRQQDKDKDGDLAGYNFIINVEKSRRTKEKSKFSLNVTFDGGVNKWSGLMDIAVECGIVVKPKVGWYAKIDTDTGEVIEKNYRLAQTNNAEFWNDIIKSPKFIEYCNKTFKVSHNKLISEINQEGEA